MEKVFFDHENHSNVRARGRIGANKAQLYAVQDRE
jgi:hypothetical protein